ncbi:MAG: hypothetical protein ACXVPN_10100 [Bacteroidia bacterium]
MKTADKNTAEKNIKWIITPDMLLEQEEERTEADLTDEDLEALGPINMANDSGYDEQIKYWEELGKDRPTSEMAEYELHIDHEWHPDTEL